MSARGRAALLAVAVAAAFAVIAVAAGDPDAVESLIAGQKAAAEPPIDDELPPVFLPGNADGVQLYDAATERGASNLLCEPVAFDELIEMSRGDPSDQINVLNIDMPGIRQALERACLVHRGDSILAIGPGEQRRVEVDRFFVRREPPLCPDDSPYSLWAGFATPLDFVPQFFSTNPDLRESPNHFRAPLFMAARLSIPDAQLVKRVVPYIEDFDVTVATLTEPNCDRIYVLRRKSISADDEGLVNEEVLVQFGNEVEALWSENVDRRKASGHLRVEAFLDFNGDGKVDLMLSGDHGACPYLKVFEGQERGFVPVDLATKPCDC